MGEGGGVRRALVVVGSAVVLNVAFLVLSGAAVGAPLAAGDAPNLIATYKLSSSQCVPAAGGTVRAHVKVRMRVVNYDGVTGKDWAKHMKLKARLIPTSAGLNITRP